MKSSTKSDKIVLDTNIIISSIICKKGDPATLFEKLINEEIENYTSKEIIEELIEVLNRNEIIKKTKKETRTFILEQYLIHSQIIVPKIKHRIIEHESDNKFIDVAKEANAKYIISGDKHLLEIKEFEKIKIIRAKEYLKKLLWIQTNQQKQKNNRSAILRGGINFLKPPIFTQFINSKIYLGWWVQKILSA